MRLLSASGKMTMATGPCRGQAPGLTDGLSDGTCDELRRASLPVPAEVVLERYWAPLTRVGRALGLSDGGAARAARSALEASVAKHERTDPDRFFSAVTLALRDRFAETLGAELAKERRVASGPGGWETFASAWEREWERHLFDLALVLTRRLTDARQFELFELYAVRRRTAAEIGKTHGVTAGNLYVMKHRIAERVRRQLANLRVELGFSN